MPTAVEQILLQENTERRDSTFTYDRSSVDGGVEEMERLRISALSRAEDHSRTESVDSGIGCMAANSSDICSPSKRTDQSHTSKIK